MRVILILILVVQTLICCEFENNIQQTILLENQNNHNEKQQIKMSKQPNEPDILKEREQFQKKMFEPSMKSHPEGEKKKSIIHKTKYKHDQK